MKNKCEACGGSGIIDPVVKDHPTLEMELPGWHAVERCDACQKYKGDKEAAERYYGNYAEMKEKEHRYVLVEAASKKSETFRKTTNGYVVQTYDRETGKCISQEFVAGDEVDYEDDNGYIDEPGNEVYQPLHMVQPDEYVLDENDLKFLRVVQEALANWRDGVDPIYVGDGSRIKNSKETDSGFPYNLEEIKYVFLDPILEKMDPEEES